MDSYDHLMRLRATIPPQGSPEWYLQRYGSGNSSQYGSMFNVDGRRNKELQIAAYEIRPESNFYTSWGKLVENVSGYAFSAETGLSYQEIGSVPHPLYQSIRGSVDGFGKDDRNRLFALETKSPVKRVPSRSLHSLVYLYQIIQNIEISNADYGIYNDVRLLPCASEDILDPETARDPTNGALLICRHLKYGEASREGCSLNVTHSRPSVTTIATAIYCNDPDNPAPLHTDPTSLDRSQIDEEASADTFYVGGEETLCPSDSMRQQVCTPWYGNIFDAYTGRHSSYNFSALINLFTSYAISFRPIGHTNRVGESMRAWAEHMYSLASQTTEAIGYAFFKVDVHNIQIIKREHDFWDRVLRPVAIQWVEDVRAIKEGRQPAIIPAIAEECLPSPC